MPEQTKTLDYLRALPEYIGALEGVRHHARFLADMIVAGNSSDQLLRDGAEILLKRVEMAEELNPVMRCGS